MTSVEGFSTSPGARQLIQAVLIESELSRAIAEDETDDVKPTFAYNAVLGEISPGVDHTFALAALKVEKLVNNIAVVVFNARYVFGFRGRPITSEDEQDATIEHLLISMVWPRFRDLCEITAAQAEADFPRLPSKPDEITRKAK